jgi:hypothetical protein
MIAEIGYAKKNIYNVMVKDNEKTGHVITT